MSHREKSLTPWIKNSTEPRPEKYRDFTVEQINAEAQRPDISDEDKHAICLIRTGHHCTYLTPSMYDDAVRQGCDMANFVKNKPMPVDPGEFAVYTIIEHKLPTGEQRHTEMQRKLDTGEPLGTYHVPDKMTGVVANGSTSYTPFAPSSAARWRDCPGTMCECGEKQCQWPLCGTMGRDR
jgi:hypothetical protein